MKTSLSRLMAAAFMLFTSLTAFGQPAAVSAPESCRTQIELYCKTASTPGETAKCLGANQEKLSVDCQQELKRFVRGLEQAAEQGGGALSALSQLNSPTPPFPVVTYEGRYTPAKNETEPTLTEHRLNISAPIFQTPSDTLAASLSGANIELGRKVIIGSQEIDSLYRIELGSQYNHQLSAGRRWGLRASVGTAGDKTFETANDTSFSFNVNYGYPSRNGKGYWLLTAFLSNNSVIGNFVPIPGVVYLVKTKTFSGMFGFPIMTAQWTPSTEWAYSASLLGPTLNFEAANGSPKRVQTFVGAGYALQNFILSKREADADRLTLEEKKVSIGLRKFLLGFSQAELQLGYSFDRMLFIGQGIRNMRRGATDLESDLFIAWSLKAGF